MRSREFALTNQNALFTFRPAVAGCAANDASVLDDIDMQIQFAIVGNGFFQNAMRFVRPGFFANPAQSFGDAVNVRVHGKGRFIEKENQNAGDGFRADAFETLHERAAFFYARVLHPA